MKQLQTKLEGLILLEPKVFGDSRGYFLETYHAGKYEAFGISDAFVQDNISFSGKGILRGLHFQLPPKAQGKLVQVLRGEAFDVAVDLRLDSKTFGKWEGVILTEENKRQFYVPAGFAHGFCTLTDHVLFFYKCTDFYSQELERGLHWNDPVIGIDWPVENPVLSVKDEKYPDLKTVRNELERNGS